MFPKKSFPVWVSVISLAAVSWGCGSTPKVQRQVTVLESVGTERCIKFNSYLCYDWEWDPQLNPYSLCLASPDLDAISKSDFTALLEKGSTIVGNPTELEKLKTRVTVNGQKDWKTNCNVRKYIMEGNAAIFESKSPQSLDLADCNEMENMQMMCKGDDGKVYKSRISYCKSDPIQLGCEFILGGT